MSAHLRNDGGFTLVEVLISMLIFSLISVASLVALRATLDAREGTQAKLAEVERLAAMRALMADDFAALIVREDRDGLGTIIDPAREVLPTDRFSLTRRGRPNPGGAFARGDILRVAWRVEGGQLIRSYLPHENPAYVEPPRDRIILDGVSAMDVRPLSESPDRRLLNIRTLSDAPGVEITLDHADGTRTRHVFELGGGDV